MFRSKPSVKNTIDSLIGTSTRIDGNVIFHGGLRIDGQVRGNVLAAGETPGMLVISEHARVDGEILAAHVVVNGVVNGPITGAEMVELQPKARITGNVRYKALELHHGALVEGTLSHFDGESPRSGLKLAASKDGLPALPHPGQPLQAIPRNLERS